MSEIDLGIAPSEHEIDLGTIETPVGLEQKSGLDFDTASKTNMPVDEISRLDNVLTMIGRGPLGVSEVNDISKEAASRFGKQLYNKLVSGTLKPDIFEEDLDARARIDAQIVANKLIGQKNVDAEEVTSKYWEEYGIAKKRERDKLSSDRFPVGEAKNPLEVGANVGAGVIDFVLKVGLLKKIAPSMPENAVWETVNLSNGGKPGTGVMMQELFGGISGIDADKVLFGETGKIIGQSGAMYIVSRAGGGSQLESAINAGIPIAFKGMNLLTGEPVPEPPSETPEKPPTTPVEAKTPATPPVGAENEYAKFIGVQDNEGVTTNDNLYNMKVDIPNHPKGSTVTEQTLQEAGIELPVEKPTAKEPTLYERMADKEQITEETTNPPDVTEYTDKMTVAGTPTPDESKPKQPDIKPDKKLTEDDLDKAKERGFITSVKEVLPELKIEGQYVPRPTDPLAIKARNLIYDDIDTAERMAYGGNDDTSVAVASELIKYYGDKARGATDQVTKDMLYDKAAKVANDTAHKLTEAGRTVQAASILGRLTPEGQVRFAAREIHKYNEDIDAANKKGGLGGLRKKIPELTGEQGRYILEEMRQIESMPEGRDKALRFNKLQDHVAGLVPTPLYKKLITIWKAGLITGIKTSGLNIYANAAHLASESIKDIPATMVDKIASLFTGKRTVTMSVKGIGEGGLKGAKKIPDYIINGYSERDIGTKLDYTRISMGKGGLAKALQAYTDSVFRTLGSEDQPFYYAAKIRSLYEQAKVDAINKGLTGEEAQRNVDFLMENPTNNMIEYASKDAETAIFINKTSLGDIARGVQKLPGGEVVVPFGRTPSAVAMQIVNYSPVGIPKTIIENIGKGRFDQRAFSQGIGRGITGTAALAIGAALYKAGIMSLDRPNTEKEQKLWEIEGRVANSVLINGKWRTVNAYGPVGNLLIVGGQFKQAFDEVGSPTEAMAQALAGSAKTFTEQTFVRGISGVISAISDPERSAANVAGSTISSAVPTIIGDIAKATDTEERRAETIPQKVLAKIPGARQRLEPQINVLGEERTPTANPVELMIDPTRPSKAISTPVVNELRRLWDEGWEVSPALMGDKNGYKPLSQQENTLLWKRVGSITKVGLEKLVTNSVYTELPDEKKADYIGKLVEESQKIAKIEATAKKLSGLEGKELMDMIFELRKSGLATEDIIPIALSKRNPKKVK